MNMKLVTALLFVVSSVGLGVRAEAALFGATSSGTPGELYTLDPATGAVVQDIGALNDSSSTNYPITGLAFDPITGVLYGSTGNIAPVPGELVSIDPATALVTDIGSFNLTVGTLSDLAFDTAGNLYGISSKNGPQLYSVNLGTGQATLVGNTGLTSTEGGGLAVSSAGVFFGTPTASQFGTYDSTTGAFTNIANPAKPAGGGAYAALEFDGSVLYGLNSGPGSPPPTHLVTIDPTSGAVTDIGASVIALDAIAFQAALSADYNHDGTVDAADYVVWRKSAGTPAGYNLWRSHFGLPSGSGSGSADFGQLSRTGASLSQAAVPEPGTLVLLIFAAAGVALRGRHIA